jgi:arsenate reductase (glutaredoxin)
MGAPAQPVLYGIPNCDTVKKARAWLAQASVEYAFHDFKREGLPAALLDRWIESVGVQALVNRRGTTWRRLEDAARVAADEAAAARALLLAQPSLVKRPVVDWPGGVTSVGFDAAQFARCTGRA